MGRFDNYKFHCSSIGDIMTEPRSKKDGLSETCKAHLLEIWIADKYKRHKFDTNKYMEKGTQQEEEGITLYSRVSKKLFVKNQQYFENEFICGTPDIIHDGIVRDIKCSWSIHTFYGVLHKATNKDYAWQLNGYMALTDLNAARLAYVLINTPDLIIEQEKSRLRYKIGTIDAESDEEYLMLSAEIDKNHRFDDIPIEQRWIEQDIEKVSMEPVYARVEECRDFLNKL